jgi:hypothetical protein
MPTYRCRFIVNKRLCKKKSLNFHCFCFQHYCLFHKKNIPIIIFIQQFFRAFRLKKLLFYYRRLPIELQRRIIWFSREPFYIHKQHNSIKIIITNKIRYFFYNYNEIIFIYINQQFHYNFPFDELNHIYFLLNKYFIIFNCGYYINIPFFHIFLKLAIHFIHFKFKHNYNINNMIEFIRLCKFT